MTFIRLVLASIFLYIFVKFTKKLQKFEGKDFRLMFLAAFCEPFLYHIGESYGILHSSGSFAAIMVALIPLVVPVAMWLVFRTRSSWQVILGLIVSFGGILYMILGDNLELIVDIRGVLFLSLAILSAVVYILCIQRLSEKYNNFTIVFYQTFLSTLMFLPLFVTIGWKEFRTVPFDFLTYKNFMMLAIFGSGVAFVCLVESIKQIGAVKTQMFTYLIPIVTAIGAFFILDKIFSWQEIIGIGIVIIGLFVSQIKLKNHKNITK
jgi:drug/metabolite transporter (DMT)-like permease